jgi:hypothetical protein
MERAELIFSGYNYKAARFMQFFICSIAMKGMLSQFPNRSIDFYEKRRKNFSAFVTICLFWILIP